METTNRVLGGIPRLIEPGTKYFINASLDHCREFKIRHYNILYNIGMFVGLVVTVGTILYVKYKTKNDKVYQEQLRLEKEDYIKNRVNEKVVNHEYQFPLRLALFPGLSCMYCCGFCGRNQ